MGLGHALLAADDDDVELDRFLGLGFGRGNRHLGLYRLGINDGETSPENGVGKGLPSLIAGMVVSENQQAIVFENAPALAEDVLQLGGEVVGVRVLDLQGATCGRALAWGSVGRQLLPGVEEIREF